MSDQEPEQHDADLHDLALQHALEMSLADRSGPSSSIEFVRPYASTSTDVTSAEEGAKPSTKFIRSRVPQIKESTATAQLNALRQEQRRKYEASRARDVKEQEDQERKEKGATGGSSGIELESVAGSGTKRSRSPSVEAIEVDCEVKGFKKARIAEIPSHHAANDPAIAGPSTIGARSPPTCDLNYPSPRIFLTRTTGRLILPSSRNTITLGQIFDKVSLRSCFLFSFFIGQDELFSYLPLAKSGPTSARSAQCIIGRDLNMEAYLPEACNRTGVYRSLNGENKRAFKQEEYNSLTTYLADKYKREYGPNYRAVYTSMVGRTGCVHSKFGMIAYEGFMRVFITSGNLMALDTVHGDNHWFIVDLPELPKKRPAGSFPSNFEQELLEHASLLGCPLDYINTVYGRYDYSSVSSCHIVASIPGNFSAEKAFLYGALRLRECVRPYMKTKKEPLMEICTGSIGGMQGDWLRAMYHCFSGAMYDDQGKTDLPPFKLFFPTKLDVDAVRPISREGATQIGSHFKYNEASDGIKAMFHHYMSKDQVEEDSVDREGGKGCLFHQKFYMCFKDNFEDDDPPLWFCIGSHNFSKAAWGDPKDDLRRKKGPRVKRLGNVSNYELSVVMPGSMLKTMLEPGSDWQDVVPHQRKTKRYSGTDKPFNSSAWVSGASGGENLGGPLSGEPL